MSRGVGGSCHDKNCLRQLTGTKPSKPWGFIDFCMRVLTERNKQEIKRYFKWLSSNLWKNNMIVLVYSGMCGKESCDFVDSSTFGRCEMPSWEVRPRLPDRPKNRPYHNSVTASGDRWTNQKVTLPESWLSEGHASASINSGVSRAYGQIRVFANQHTECSH